jgi:hypothetical protein
MILTILVFGILSFAPAISINDSLQHHKTMNLFMDSLEVMPLPNISGIIHGNTPVDLSFDQSILNFETNSLTINGYVIDHKDNVEIPGVKLVIGTLDSSEADAPIFIPRTSVLTDHRGAFSFNAKIKKSDILIIVWLGYLEKVYSFKKIGL